MTDLYEGQKRRFGEDYLLLGKEAKVTNVDLDDFSSLSPLSIPRNQAVVVTGSSKKGALVESLGIAVGTPRHPDEAGELNMAEETHEWFGFPLFDEYLVNMLPSKAITVDHPECWAMVGTDTTVFMLLEPKSGGTRVYEEYIDTSKPPMRRAYFLCDRFSRGAKTYCLHSLLVQSRDRSERMWVVVAMRYDFNQGEIDLMCQQLQGEGNKLPVGVDLSQPRWHQNLRSVHVAYNGYIGEKDFRKVYRVKDAGIDAFATLPAGFGPLSLSLLGVRDV